VSTARGTDYGPLVFLALAFVAGLVLVVLFGPGSPLEGEGGASLLYLFGIAVPVLTAVATIAYYLLSR